MSEPTKIFDRFTNKHPDLGLTRMMPIHDASGKSPLKGSEYNLDDFIRRTKEATAVGAWCYLGREEHQWVYSWQNPAAVSWMLPWHIWIHKQIRRAVPDCKIGIYSGLPSQWAGKEDEFAYDARYRVDQYIAPLAGLMDYISVLAYPYSDDFDAWAERTRAQIERAEMYHKPIFAWLTAYYPEGSTGGVAHQAIASEFIERQLELIDELTDGAIFWGKWEVSLSTTGWWKKALDMTCNL